MSQAHANKEKLTTSGDSQNDLVSTLRTLEFGKEAKATPNKVRVKNKYVILVVLFFAMLFVGFRYYQSQPVSVSVEVFGKPSKAVASQNVQLEVSGYVVAPETATVSSNVIGRVTEVFVELGDEVKKGQIVATLDARSANIELATDKTNLRSQLEMRDVFQQDLDLAIASRNRIERLWQDDLVSEEIYEQAKSQVIAKKIALTNTQQSIDSLNNRILLNQQMLDDLKIRAPFDGTITAMTANVGEIISPASAGGTFTRSGICTITDTNIIEFHFDVNERFLPQVTNSKRIDVSFVSQPGLTIAAKIKQIAPITNNQTGTVIVIAEPLNETVKINPGSTATGVFYSESGAEKQATNEFKIPEIQVSAVHQEGGRDFIYIAIDGVAKKHPVEGERITEDKYRFKEPFKQSVAVITWSERMLSDGQAIQYK